MKKLLLYTLIAAISLCLGYVAMTYCIPYLVIYRLSQRMQENQTEYNEFYHSPIIDATSRGVVRPNPDFLYSICPYDLGEGILKIQGELPDSSYWSIAFYQNNTVNYFVKNDQQFSSKNITLVLIPKGTKYAPKEGEELIESPGQKGIVLTRLLLPRRDASSIARMQALQKTFKVIHTKNTPSN